MYFYVGIGGETDERGYQRYDLIEVWCDLYQQVNNTLLRHSGCIIRITLKNPFISIQHFTTYITNDFPLYLLVSSKTISRILDIQMFLQK